MKKRSTSLAIKEMQIKASLKFYLASQNDYHQESKQKMLVRRWEKEDPYTLLVGM
jgi:hypothetical protein